MVRAGLAKVFETTATSSLLTMFDRIRAPRSFQLNFLCTFLLCGGWLLLFFLGDARRYQFYKKERSVPVTSMLKAIGR